LRKSHTQKFEQNIFKKLKRNFWRKLLDTLEKKNYTEKCESPKSGTKVFEKNL
jgi:hypothetical protein